MDYFSFNQLSHTIIGSLAFIGGIVALIVKKGSKAHIFGGRVFYIGMTYAAISVIGFMIKEFRPLAVLMSISTLYLMSSSFLALRHVKPYARILDSVLMVIPILLFIFTLLQLIRILPEISFGMLARLLFTATFGILAYRDITLFRKRPQVKLFYLKRHAFRMILAFGFAIMAVLRIGVKLDFLGLAFTTFTPMLLALLCAFWTERNIEKVLSNKVI